MSIEQYEGTDLEFGGSNNDLPNTISPTPAPPFTSTANRTNRVNNPFVSDDNNGSVIFWIKGPLGLSANEAFANNLDPNKLVELALTLEWDDVPTGEKIVITDVYGENGNVPAVQYEPDSYDWTGTGTMGSPMNLLIYIDPSDIQDASAFHFLKVGIEFDTMRMPVVPEPATWALMMIGLAGAATARRRTPHHGRSGR